MAVEYGLMKLYLVRHGIATQRLSGNVVNDAQRPLTEEGRSETKQVAIGLKRLGIKPDWVVSSPLKRAIETAEIIAETFNISDKLQISEALCPGSSVSELFKSIKDLKPSNEVFLVGHEPDIGRLAACLLWAGPELDLPFKKAGVCRLDITSMPPTAPATLKWFITPKIASAIAFK